MPLPAILLAILPALIVPALWILVGLVILFVLVTGIVNNLIIAIALGVLGFMLAQYGAQGVITQTERRYLPFMMLLAGIGLFVWGLKTLVPGMIPFSVSQTVGIPAVTAASPFDFVPLGQTVLGAVPSWVLLVLFALFIFAGWFYRKDIQKVITVVRREL